ncbi:hypothetical protein P886_2006 [Alteromonadaceae bacterium 2753L.S.0a.02]|nr:hypothetical protein P886_2006 [Alteromonadaceae bacterium 2753L.S.0a.02]
MIKNVLVLMFSFLGVLAGCTASCKSMPEDDSNIAIREESSQLVVRNSKAKQLIDPCPTFELQSISCNREESIEVHRDSKAIIETIKEQESDDTEE